MEQITIFAKFVEIDGTHWYLTASGTAVFVPSIRNGLLTPPVLERQGERQWKINPACERRADKEPCLVTSERIIDALEAAWREMQA